MSPGVTYFIIILQLIWIKSTYGKTIDVDPTSIIGNDSEDCLTGEVPCLSLQYALTNLQNDDYVNITSDSVLLPIVKELNNLDNITIRGQGNTTVMCNNTGGLSCNGCSNVIIEGIIWDQCGDPEKQNRSYPDAFGGLNFTNVTNLSIANCVLQNSRVRALSLHLIAGFINITDSQFLSNINNATIYCFQAAVYIHCVTENREVTSAVYVQDTTSEASISVSNCLFSNNGHFGNVTDDDPPSVEFEMSEIADGAAIKVLQTNSVNPINIAIDNSTFMYNRGRSGGAVNINVSQSQVIKFNNVKFWYNSVVRFYVNSSALMMFLRNTSSTVLELSSCDFQYNSDGRNMIGYIVAGEPSNILINNCNFLTNEKYDVGLIELNMQSQSSVNFVNSHLANNAGNALLYVQLRSSGISVLLHNISAINNTGASVLRRGGLLGFRVFENNCTVNITRMLYVMNRFSRNGGGLYITGSFRTGFRCRVQDSIFDSNIGLGQGAVIFSLLQSDNAYVFTIYNSTFVNNTGNSIVRIGKIPLMEDLVIRDIPLILFLGQSSNFENNTGTAIRLSDAILVGSGTTNFISNVAQSGAALYLTDSYTLSIISSFKFNFFRNFAIVRGGAIFIDLSTNLLAVQCTWLLFQVTRGSLCDRSDLSVPEDCPQIDGRLLCNELPQQSGSDAGNPQTCRFSYSDNSASVAGSTIFYNVPVSMSLENSSNPNSIFYIPIKDHCMNSSNGPRNLATQPNKLILKAPATCLDNNCTEYYINGITLGQEINIPAQILGYNNESAEATTFFITCVENCSNTEIIGRMPVLINEQLSDFHIIGQKIGSTMSVRLQLSSDTITLNLTVTLTSCSPGYVYDSSTMQCECFTRNEIISCSPNTTIQRDYWFGVVDGINTVSICPNGYCNFSRERKRVDPGRFLLSPIQDDQCNEHRTGPACGECDPDYTLSYDSVDCVSIDDCHYKYIIAVIVWTVFYWILVILFLFALMWFITKHLEYKNGIGYLYGIIYYYSVADILLGQILSSSDHGLNILVSILSIVFKLNPGFDLFKFCFVRGMQRIDQYFINYIHPTAVLLFLVILAISANCSKKLAESQLVRRIIIPVICLILTIAYTSIADTSLQLLRHIKFTDVDGSYVYLSPSIRYFTGRHIVYFLVALLYEIVIVFGLPLLLILNNWFSFTNMNLICIKHVTMKPLFDQFKGCYKDKYRWFAAVYLVCRQVILIIVVIGFSDYYIELYLLTFVCLATATLHYTIQPYENDILNKCDGIMLLLLLLIVSLQMVSFSNGFTTSAVEGTAYLWLLLPIVSMFGILLFVLLKPKLAEYRFCNCAKNNNATGAVHDNTLPLLVTEPSRPLQSQDQAINRGKPNYNYYQESLFDHIPLNGN